MPWLDAKSGRLLAQAGGGMAPELATAGNTKVVRVRLKLMKSLVRHDVIEDILITPGR